MKRLDIDDGGVLEDKSRWKLSKLFHDAICALLEAHCTDDAEKVCEAALQFHASRLDLGNNLMH